jgi:mono/diheme cytochrome c family protein
MKSIGLVVASLTAVIMLLASPLTASGQQLDSDSVAIPEMTPSLNIGQLNYEAYCAECHGKNAAGTDKGPTFIHRVYHPGHHGDAAFMIAPKQGARAHHWKFGDMKPVEGVKDAQLQSILEYVRALQKANGLF